jgi:tetrahydromethanopterin S-methyltransferase subunit G
MNSMRSRLIGLVDRGEARGVDPATIEQLAQRLDAIEATTRDELDRHAAIVREVAADLAERLAAIERRLDALEAAADA